MYPLTRFAAMGAVFAAPLRALMPRLLCCRFHYLPMIAAICIGVAATDAQAEPLDLSGGEHILNLSAREFGSLPAGLPTHPVDFPAGKFVISIITPQTHEDAVFTAWSNAFGNAGTWHTSWRAWRDDEEEIFISGGQFTSADSAEDALAATNPERLVTPFTLDEPATLRFGFGDNVLHDNQGGSSLRIVPEPAAVGLLALGGVLLLRRRICTITRF